MRSIRVGTTPSARTTRATSLNNEGSTTITIIIIENDENGAKPAHAAIPDHLVDLDEMIVRKPVAEAVGSLNEVVGAWVTTRVLRRVDGEQRSGRETTKMIG